mgnify:CR=1 FL=1
MIETDLTPISSIWARSSRASRTGRVNRPTTRLPGQLGRGRPGTSTTPWPLRPKRSTNRSHPDVPVEDGRRRRLRAGELGLWRRSCELRRLYVHFAFRVNRRRRWRLDALAGCAAVRRGRLDRDHPSPRSLLRPARDPRGASFRRAATGSCASRAGWARTILAFAGIPVTRPPSRDGWRARQRLRRRRQPRELQRHPASSWRAFRCRCASWRSGASSACRFSAGPSRRRASCRWTAETARRSAATRRGGARSVSTARPVARDLPGGDPRRARASSSRSSRERRCLALRSGLPAPAGRASRGRAASCRGARCAISPGPRRGRSVGDARSTSPARSARAIDADRHAGSHRQSCAARPTIAVVLREAASRRSR